MEEIELKLRLPAEQAMKLKRSPLLRALSHGRPVTRHLRSVYFDTADWLLHRHDMALRVRDDGRHRVQTLKVPAGPSHGLQVYREIEHEIAGEAPDLSRIDDEGLQAFFATDDVAGALAPVFETDVERMLRPVQLFDSSIEVAVDVGMLRAGDSERAICEAELELKEGRPSRLFELALGLHESVPLAVETRSKSQRGYDLVSAHRAGWVKAQPVRLEPGLTAAAAFARIAHSCLDQIRDNQPGILEERDPEAVHQMRVGVRRLRALVGAYRPWMAEQAVVFITEELRWLQQISGPARDWHVFAEEALQPACDRLPGEAGLSRLLEQARRIEARAVEEACHALESPRPTTLLLRFALLLHDGGWIAPGEAGAIVRDEPVEQFARRLLDRRYRKLRKFGGKHARLDQGQLHKLRIHAKKMRYLGEFSRELYPRKATKSFIEHLAELQEILGSVQDAVVGRDRLTTLEAESGNGSEAHRIELARATGIVTGWLESRTAANLQRLHRTWRRFRRGPTFWDKG
jgi:triphosphatase